MGYTEATLSKKMKSVENINRYEAFPFSPQEMTRKMPLEIIFSVLFLTLFMPNKIAQNPSLIVL